MITLEVIKERERIGNRKEKNDKSMMVDQKKKISETLSYRNTDKKKKD